MPYIPPVARKVLVIVSLIFAVILFGTMLHLADDRKGCDATTAAKTWQGRLTTQTATIGTVVFSVMLAQRLFTLLPDRITDSAYGLLIMLGLMSAFIVFLFAVVVDHTRKCGGRPKEQDGLGRFVWTLDIVVLVIASLLLLICVGDAISIPWGGPYATRLLSDGIGAVKMGLAYLKP